MRFTRIVAFTTTLLVLGCATASYDVPDMQRDFSEAMQSSETLVQKAQTDFREKSVLVDNLRKGGSPEYRSSEADIDRRLKNMDGLMQKITDGRKQMVKANADIASIGYNRTQVRAGEPEYDRLKKAAQGFQEAAQELSRSAVAYSLESNSLADLVSQKRLFLSFDVSEFDKRVAEQIRSSQENLKEMEKELGQTEAQIKSATAINLKEAESMVKEMEMAAQLFSTQAQKLAPLSKEIHDLTAGTSRISSMDANWSQLQKAVNEFEQVTQDLEQTRDRFLKKTQSFRASLKANH